MSSLCSSLELKTAAQESYPKYHLLDGQMAGICMEIMRAVEDTDQDLRFVGANNFLPFKRLQSYLEKGKIDVFFGMKKTEKRLDKYQFIETPLYELHYILATSQSQANTVMQLSSLKKHSTLTVAGSAASRFIKDRGINPVEVNGSPQKMLQLLQLGRGDYAFYHDLGLKAIIRDMDLQDDITILPNIYHRYEHSIAFGKHVPKPVVARVANAMDELNKNGQLDLIRKKYGLID